MYDRLLATEVSWYEDLPRTSLRLITDAAASKADVVIDVGAGASSLVDALLEAGWNDITVLDLSAVALVAVQNRLQGRSVQGAYRRAPQFSAFIRRVAGRDG